MPGWWGWTTHGASGVAQFLAICEAVQVAVGVAQLWRPHVAGRLKCLLSIACKERGAGAREGWLMRAGLVAVLSARAVGCHDPGTHYAAAEED